MPIGNFFWRITIEAAHSDPEIEKNLLPRKTILHIGRWTGPPFDDVKGKIVSIVKTAGVCLGFAVWEKD